MYWSSGRKRDFVHWKRDRCLIYRFGNAKVSYKKGQEKIMAQGHQDKNEGRNCQREIENINIGSSLKKTTYKQKKTKFKYNFLWTSDTLTRFRYFFEKCLNIYKFACTRFHILSTRQKHWDNIWTFLEFSSDL